MRSCRFLFLAVVLVGSVAAFAAGSPMAIVASTAPGLSPGDLVIEGQAISVPAGAIVQLFTVTGREINLSGPFDGVPGNEGVPPPENKLKVLAAAVFGRTDIVVSSAEPTQSEEQTSGGEPSESSTTTGADASGTWCLAKEVPTVLVGTVPDQDQAQLVSLEDGQSAPLGWTPEAKIADWPSALPPKDGGHYSVQMNGKAAASFTVRLMPEAANGAGRLAQMAAAGCSEQVQVALKSLGESPAKQD